MRSNQLSDSLHAAWSRAWPNLQELGVALNNLYGTLPAGVKTGRLHFRTHVALDACCSNMSRRMTKTIMTRLPRHCCFRTDCLHLERPHGFYASVSQCMSRHLFDNHLHLTAPSLIDQNGVLMASLNCKSSASTATPGSPGLYQIHGTCRICKP